MSLEVNLHVVLDPAMQAKVNGFLDKASLLLDQLTQDESADRQEAIALKAQVEELTQKLGNAIPKT